MTIPEFNKIMISRTFVILVVLIVANIGLYILLPTSWGYPRVSFVHEADGAVRIIHTSALSRVNLLAIGLTSLICFRQLKAILEASREFLSNSDI